MFGKRNIVLTGELKKREELNLAYLLKLAALELGRVDI
jgi:hypothetical protein